MCLKTGKMTGVNGELSSISNSFVIKMPAVVNTFHEHFFLGSRLFIIVNFMTAKSTEKKKER